MKEQCAFLDVFPSCAGLGEVCGGLDKAALTSVTVDREKLEMQCEAWFSRMPAPVETKKLEDALAAEYGLSAVHIRADYPRAETKKPSKKAGVGQVILGRAVRGKPVEISSLTLDSGNVTVCGKVFAVNSREIVKTGSTLLSFCLTDGGGSVHVSKYIPQGSEETAAAGKIRDGMYLLIAGSVGYNRYDEDLALEPKSIQTAPAPSVREDTAAEKRVELHLHTRYSNLDALTNPAAAIKRAARWGHPAVAVTDHGVVHAFPDAWEAAEKAGIKMIYGMEGYFINDVDERLAVHGETDAGLDTDFVAFDLECTGLRSDRDRITEIGAVLFSHGEVKDTFSTFVDPHIPIPAEVVRLTSITDADVHGAPEEDEALRSFLAFAGDRPLVAHNADFDVGFLAACAARHGVAFDPVYLDTLVLSQTLLPQLRRHKLDLVSSYLGLPEFNHHRASDDALVCARIYGKLIPMLRDKGAEKLSDVERVLRRAGGDKPRQKPKHIILLVQNKTGLKNLYQLISDSYLEHFHRFPLIPKSLLMQRREGLIIGSACEAGEFFQAMLRGVSDRELKRIGAFYDYLEIQPVCNNRFLIDSGKARDAEELRGYNRRVAKIARELNKPLVATGDVHFLDPEDEIFRRILLAGRKIPDADRDLPIYFRTTDEMLEEFSYLGEQECYDAVIGNPRKIAGMCETIELLPKGKLFAPKIENSAEDLKRLVYERMHELYGDEPPEIVAHRVEAELNTILEHEYDVIYMSAQKLVQNSLENGYLVGSRGSVGSSVVAYLSGITEVNALPPHYRCPKCRRSDFANPTGAGCGADMPDMACPACGAKYLKDGFDIPFETFLGFPGNEKTPDIDLNFSGEYQAKAHKYTEELFGSDHVFRAGTIETLAEKNAYGFVKKYLEEREMQVTKAEETRLILGCVGVKQTTGQHPGGLVVIPQDMDVTDFCPVQHPADDPERGIITTHFEYHCMEDNLLKLDELGHDDPTMIRMLEDLTGVNARELPLDDAETMAIFRSPAPLGLPEDDPIIGKTGSIGIPEFGTGFTRQMLVDTQPEGFDILVRLSGFSHGTDVWLGNAKDLITSRTATVKQTVGCRDDIMLYLIEKGMEPMMAFQIMEAVRKGKVKRSGFSAGWEEKMHELDVPQWYIDSLAKIAYLFPKAHAVAYVLMAFRIAWFKVHRPLAFYSAYFYRRGQKGAFDAQLMTRGIEPVKQKLREFGQAPKLSDKEKKLVTTLESVYEFYLRGFSFAGIDLYESDAMRFLPVGEKLLRPPFNSVNKLGAAAAADLAACRDSGVRFVSVEELSAACPKVSQSHIDTLRSLGALGDLPESSQMSLF